MEKKEYQKLYKLKNREKLLEYGRRYSAKNADKARARSKKWYSENKERAKAYALKNRERIRARMKTYLKEYHQKNKSKLRSKFNEKIESDLNFMLARSLRRRIYMAIKNSYSMKAVSSIELLGDSIDNVRKHIEEKFTNGMVWSNYGKWHIDHIIPLCKFDLRDKEQQKQAFHYTNLQPLWAEDNFKKSKKLYTR